jgi:hypothetical protein
MEVQVVVGQRFRTSCNWWNWKHSKYISIVKEIMEVVVLSEAKFMLEVVVEVLGAVGS